MKEFKALLSKESFEFFHSTYWAVFCAAVPLVNHYLRCVNILHRNIIAAPKTKLRLDLDQTCYKPGRVIDDY